MYFKIKGGSFIKWKRNGFWSSSLILIVCFPFTSNVNLGKIYDLVMTSETTYKNENKIHFIQFYPKREATWKHLADLAQTEMWFFCFF